MVVAGQSKRDLFVIAVQSPTMNPKDPPTNDPYFNKNKKLNYIN